MASKRVKTDAVQVPQSREQADIWIAEIGQRQRTLERIETAMNDRLAKVKARYEAAAAPHAADLAQLAKGLQMWCEANRTELTDGGKIKTHAFPAGEVAWRKRPPSVGIRGAKQVIHALKSLGLGRFIRTKESVDKQAIRKEPEAVAGITGISIKSKGEDFVVTPFETKLEVVAK